MAWGAWPSGAPVRRAAPLLATVVLGRGVATFGQALPRGAAREGLAFDGLASQVDVKTRWPDGSIRFAVVSARSPRAGRYSLRAAPRTEDSLDARAPAVSVAFRVGGQTYVAKASGLPSADAWLSGPIVREWRRVLAPRASSGDLHPLLRVVLDTRVFAGGYRIDLTVENVFDRPGASRVVYDVEVRVGGATVFSRSGVRHHYLTRWRKLFRGGTPPAAVGPDLEPAERAGALPRYLGLVARRLDVVRGDSFDILREGGLERYMPEHGGRPELAPYPDWTARYLAHLDPRQLPYVLAQGELAGSWPVHIREAGGAYVSLDRIPGYWLDPRGQGPRGDLRATGPLVPDNAHQPSLAYVPYLLTGDRYYADELAFWANYVLLSTYPGDAGERRLGQGILASNETRGIAWGLRNLADAAAYLPDTHELKGYLRRRVEANLAWADRVAAEQRNPLGAYFTGRAGEDEGTDLWSIPRPWQNNYVAWALDHASQQGFAGGTVLRDALVRFQLKLFTDSEVPHARAAPYYLVVGRKGAGERDVRWLGSIGEAYRLTLRTVERRGEKMVPIIGWYGVDARLALLIARRERMPGAGPAYAYLRPLLTRVPHTEGIPDLALRAGWAIADLSPASRI